MAVSGARVTLVADHGPSKSFELPSGEERRIRLGRAKENDVQIDQKGTSWFHCELRLLEPERRGSSGALVKLRDTSTNGVGLKVPGSSTVRLTKGTDHPVPDGTTIIVPFKVKAEDGKSQDELRSSVKVSVSLIGDAVGAAPEVVELVPPLLPQAPAKPATLRETEAEPKPKVAAPTLPKAAAPKSSSGARAKAPAKAPAPPKAASAKSQSRPQARDAPELLRAWEEAPQRAKAVVEEDFPPAIPAPSGPPPGAWDPPAKEKPKPKEERTRRPDGEKDRRSRSRRRLRRDRSRERRRSKGRSERRRPDSSREAAKSPEGAAAPKATSPPPQPQPAEAPVSTVDKVPEDDTVKRFEEMMKRVKAFALEKEATYEDRVAEAKAHEEAEKRKREEEEEKEKEEAKRKEEEMKKEEEELEAKRRKEESAESAESKESAKEAPSERRASGAPTSSNMQNQTMQMMNNMNMMMANMMGMGGMMPGMGVGMPQMHMPNTQAVPKGANLQGFVAVKSGHPPPPSGVGGAELSRDGIGAVTKSKSAGAPPPLTAPSPAMSSQGWSETFSGKAQPPPPPPPSRCDRSRESGFDRGPRHEGGGFERADEGGSRHDRGGDDRDARGEARPRRGFTDAPEGARGDTNGGDPRDSKGHDRGGGGRSGRGRSSLADWQEKDIEDLCDRFQLDSYLQGKLLEALGKRSETFTQDLSSLKQTLESARNPPGLLKVKLREMEDGTFVAKGEKGKGKGFGEKGKDGGKDGKDGGKGGKGPVMSAARRAELFGGDSPPPARRSRSRKRSRSRSRSRSRRSRRRSPQGGDSGAEEPRKRLPRGSNFS